MSESPTTPSILPLVAKPRQAKYPVELFSGADYLNLPTPEYAWVVQGMLALGGLTLCHANPKAGKSTALMQLCGAINDPNTDHFFHQPLNVHGKVAYLQLDTPPSLWRSSEYLRKVVDAGVDLNQTYFHDRETMPLGLVPFNIRNLDHFNWLGDWVAKVDPVVTIIDTYRACFRGNENDADITEEVIALLQHACGASAVVLVHHARKGNPEFPDAPADAPRGSTHLAGRVDVIWHVTKSAWNVEGRGGEMHVPITFNNDTKLLIATARGIDPNMVAAEIDKNPLISEHQLAVNLSIKTGQSIEAVRAKLRRLKGKK